MTSNRDLGRIFDELATGLELQGANSFKVSSHRRAARTVVKLNSELTALPPDDALRLMQAAEGLGKGTQERILEILSTGELREHKDILKQVPRGLFGVLSIPGVGPKAVRTLWVELGVESLPELKTALERGDLEKLPGMGKKSVLNIRQAVDWAVKAAQSTPLGIALPIARGLVAQLENAPGSLRQPTPEA